MGLLTDDRAQAGSAKTAIVLIVSIVVATIVGAVMVPVAIDNIESDDSETFTQEVSTWYDVNGELESNVNSIDTTNSQATVELNDTRTSTTTTKTIGVGSTVSYELEGGTVNVTVDSIDDTTTPNQSTVTYEFTKDYAYSSGASALWGILGLTIVLGVFLVVLRRAVSYA